MNKTHEKNDRSKRENSEDIPLLEWIVGAVGLILVLGVSGFMFYQAATQTPSPPRIVIEVNSITRTETGYLVEMRVINHGSTTAQDLTIEGELMQNGEVVETRSTTLDYVPDRSERIAGLFFSQDPNAFALELYPVGYQEP